MKPVFLFRNSVELYRIYAEDIVFIEASANYTIIHLVGGGKCQVSFQLGEVWETMQSQSGKGENDCAFACIGRSIIVNCDYVYHIDIRDRTKVLTLRDFNGCHYDVQRKTIEEIIKNVPQERLKDLKEYIEKEHDEYLKTRQ